MATSPGSNEWPVVHWWCRCFPDSLAAGVALKDQQKMAPVNLYALGIELPLTHSLSDFEPKFFTRWRAGAAPNTNKQGDC